MATTRRKRRSLTFKLLGCLSRYRDTCNGLTAYTLYPAVINAATHGPRSVSIPISTSASSASSPSPSAIIACNRAIPATPSGNRALTNRRPAASITSTSWCAPAQSSPTNSTLPPPPRSPCAASGRTISDLMNQCSRHTTAGTPSHQRSTLPTHQQGHDLSTGLPVQCHTVLPCQRPGASLPDGQPA